MRVVWLVVALGLLQGRATARVDASDQSASLAGDTDEFTSVRSHPACRGLRRSPIYPSEIVLIAMLTVGGIRWMFFIMYMMQHTTTLPSRAKQELA
jgi:hypothetical protein